MFVDPQLGIPFPTTWDTLPYNLGLPFPTTWDTLPYNLGYRSLQLGIPFPTTWDARIPFRCRHRYFRGEFFLQLNITQVAMS